MEISLGTLLSLGTTTTSTSDGIYISNRGIATTLTSTMSTASTSGGPILEVHAAAARDYVSSMSVEEIDTMIMQIEEKEMELSFDDNEVKVKKLGSIDSKKI